MISDRTSAILLITAYFSKDISDSAQPLTIAEWSVFGTWLVEKNLNPEELLTGYIQHLSDWEHTTITRQRLTALLERKASLAIALDKWTKAGIWILNRSETAYPQRIRERLKNAAPPILFGLGNQKLLNQKYVAILGAKDIIAEDEVSCASVVGQVIGQGYGVVTGGNKGIEELALLGALAAGAQSVAIVSDTLLKRSTSSQLRSSIIGQKLVLISPYNPEAGPNLASTAATTNLVYIQSELSIVVRAELKGMTMSGAIENIAKSWVPVYVIKPITAGKSGNSELVKIGGQWFEEGF